MERSPPHSVAAPILPFELVKRESEDMLRSVVATQLNPLKMEDPAGLKGHLVKQ